jgi:hypothetical protein
VLLKSKSDGSRCWSIFHENSAFWFDNKDKALTTQQYPRAFVQKKYQLDGNKIWRHIAVTFDENTDHIHVYYDGALAVSTWFGSSIKVADPPSSETGVTLTLGRLGTNWF